MAVLVGVITDGGLFLGGVGATQAEALGSACNVLGEDFEIFATVEMEDVVDKVNVAVETLENADPHPVAPSPAGAAAGGAADGAAQVAADPVDEDPADVRAGDDEDDDGGDRSGEGGVEEEPLPGQGADPQCAVCGKPVTADRAEVSTEDFGQPQCRACSPD